MLYFSFFPPQASDSLGNIFYLLVCILCRWLYISYGSHNTLEEHVLELLAFFISFLITYIVFQVMINLLSIHFLFFIFSFFCLLGTCPFLYYLVLNLRPRLHLIGLGHQSQSMLYFTLKHQVLWLNTESVAHPL